MDWLAQGDATQVLQSDTNVHIIGFYKGIQKKSITPKIVREYSVEAGEKLASEGESFYYKVRTRFN